MCICLFVCMSVCCLSIVCLSICLFFPILLIFQCNEAFMVHLYVLLTVGIMGYFLISFVCIDLLVFMGRLSWVQLAHLHR